jgi:hypothetical protein
LAAEVSLVCHPDTPSTAVRRVTVRVDRHMQALEVSFLLEGDVQALRIPAPRVPRIAERLWQHTCCEIFVARKGEAAYHELNFSPSGEWAAYAFCAYRRPVPLVGEMPAPGIRVQRSRSALQLHARIPAAQGVLALGLAAVIEALDGKLAYWALKHPRGKPDFHHREAFLLELDEVRH